MLVYKLCKEFCPDKLNFDISSKLGDGADGEVFELKESDKVIKFGVLFEYPEIDLQGSYNTIIQVLDYLKNKKPLTYAQVCEYGYLGQFNRPVTWSDSGQKYILYYYVMEKLLKISDDEKRVFHSILSHEDKNLNKNFTILKIKKMLDGMGLALDFDKNKIIFFCENLKNSSIQHNDIHVRNIMKDKDGNFKLIDFDRCNLLSK